jgi:DNA-binding NtrC family response regulator
MERLSIMESRKDIDVSDLPAAYLHAASGEDACGIEDLFAIDQLKDASKAFESAFIRKKIQTHGTSIEKAAAAMGMSPDALKKKLKQMKDA